MKILKAGREAIGVEEEASDGQESEADRPAERPPETIAPARPRRGGKVRVVDVAVSKPSASKRDLVIALLERPQGAAMDDLIAATAWLPHTTRAFLSGLRKGGLNIVLSKGGDGAPSVYRIVKAGVAAAA